MAHGRIGEGILKSIGSRTPGWINNVGLSLSGGTLKMVQAGGSDFTTTDPGWFTLASNTAGRLVTLKATVATHTFIDDAGSSQIIGEEFGIKTGVAWAQDRPFYLYACNADDTDANLKFFISPQPNKLVSPATTNIGYQGVPAATPSDTNAFFLSSTDITVSHAAKPCSLIGGIRMRMTSLDDWTVQTLALASGDGISKNPYVGNVWTFPTGQMDAISGSYFGYVANAPSWATPANIIYYYTVGLNGEIEISFSTYAAGDVTAGSAQPTYLSIPYIPNSTLWNATQYGDEHRATCIGRCIIGGADNGIVAYPATPGTKVMLKLHRQTNLGAVDHDEFASTTDDTVVQFKYRAF